MHLGLLILPSKAGLSNSLTLGWHISLAYTEPESKRWNCHMVNVKMQVIWFITKTQQKKINILGDNLKIRRTGLIDHVKRPDIRVWQDDLQHASYLILHLPFCHLAPPPLPCSPSSTFQFIQVPERSISLMYQSRQFGQSDPITLLPRAKCFSFKNNWMGEFPLLFAC